MMKNSRIDAIGWIGLDWSCLVHIRIRLRHLGILGLSSFHVWEWEWELGMGIGNWEWELGIGIGTLPCEASGILSDVSSSINYEPWMNHES